MNKPLLPHADFNSLFNNSQLKVTKLGKNSLFDNSEKSKKELLEHPTFIDVEVISCPINNQIGHTCRIKLHQTNNIQVGDILSICQGQTMLTNNSVVWYGTKGQRYGHDWIYVNVSIKGDEFVDWK